MTPLLRLRPEAPQWPYSVAQLRADNPNISFSVSPSADDLAPFDVFVVQLTAQPEHDPTTHRVEEVLPVEADGIWQQAWKLVELPPAPPAPDWLTFKAAALSHPALNRAIVAAIPTAPAAALALPAALLRAEQGDPADFRGCWRAVIAAVPVSFQSMYDLVMLAQSCHLPAEFVAALQPVQSN